MRTIFTCLLLAAGCSGPDGEEPRQGAIENAGRDALAEETVVGVPVEAVGASETSPNPQPGMEVPCNGSDEDGNGTDDCLGDADGDGDVANWDCDDADPTRGPHQIDARCDGIDQNCDGVDQCDSDGDGTDDHWDCAPFDATRASCLDAGPGQSPD